MVDSKQFNGFETQEENKSEDEMRDQDFGDQDMEPPPPPAPEPVDTTAASAALEESLDQVPPPPPPPATTTTTTATEENINETVKKFEDEFVHLESAKESYA